VQTALTELGGHLDVCFANGNEELARKVIKRRLETLRLDKHIAERRALIEKQIGERRAAVDAQREQLDVMRQKAELLTVAPSGGDEWGRTDFAVTDDEVEVALLRERQQRQPS
jgi:hypothetical protein